ncbi:MAG: saccharopine dehydrogenase NADP-binding domain-containing protein [Myxococcaceae bacterium]|nr:saccharopine dehydrogenase NADP-binding domain-containing protein [Myxococcaceae bacterium]
MANWALYGATGYTGPLIAEQAVARGHRPLLMGRSADKLKALGEQLGLEHRAVSLDDAAGLRAALKGLDAVVHAAGPFIHTSAPMVQACLDEGVSYLDITGEPDVFKAVYARDAEAKARGVALIPGVGFDVIPSNCLCAWVAAKVEQPHTLDFALAGIGNPSAGTVKSGLPLVLGGGRVFREGKEVSWPLGKGTRRIRLSTREVWGAVAPVSDLYAAHKATQVPNVTAYFAVPTKLARLGRIGWPLGVAALPVLRAALGRGRLDATIEKRVKGGTAETRAAGHSHLWARAEGPLGHAEAWLDVSEGYAFTACSAVLALERVVKHRPKGALAPAETFGADFVLEVPGSRRTDVTSGQPGR